MSSPPIFQLHARVAMRDGTLLATDVYRPGGDSPVTAVLLRTAHGKNGALDEALGWVQQGFAFVAQDVRGRYDSDGDWHPFAHERADGADTLAWLAQQPWLNGQIVLTGWAYAAFTAWTAALSRHPTVRAVLSHFPDVGLNQRVTPLSSHQAQASRHTPLSSQARPEQGRKPVLRHSKEGEGSRVRLGIPYLDNTLWWWTTFGTGRVDRFGAYEAMTALAPDLLSTLPLTEFAETLGPDSDGRLSTLLAGDSAEPDYAVTGAELANLDVPAFHVSGWYDRFVAESLRQWQIAGSAIAPRPKRALIVGPWTTHLNQRLRDECDFDFGPDADLPLGELQVTWLRSVLASGEDTSSTVKVFALGKNVWSKSEDWPPGSSSETRLFASEDGTLAREMQDAGSLEIVDDPQNPFPSSLPSLDLNTLPERPDALRFTTPPCTTLSWSGSPVLHLYADSDTPSCDWCARLILLHPDGRAMLIGVTAIEASPATGDSGKPCYYTLTFPPSAVALGPGEQLRLEVSGSYFPEYARNPHTGVPRYLAVETQPARQTIYFGADTPTALVLPVPVQQEGAS